MQFRDFAMKIIRCPHSSKEFHSDNIQINNIHKYAFKFCVFFFCSSSFHFDKCVLSTKFILVIIFWESSKKKMNNLTTQHDATYRITIELYSKFSRLLLACLLVFSHFNVTIRCLWYTQQKVEHAHRISLALVWSGRKIQLPYKLQSQYTIHNKLKLRCKQTVYTSFETQTHKKKNNDNDKVKWKEESEREERAWNPHISISTSLCTPKMCPNENE